MENQKVSETFERIKVIKGVSNGIISAAQLEAVLGKLNAMEKAGVLQLMEQAGVCISSEEYNPPPVRKTTPIQKEGLCPEEIHEAFLQEIQRAKVEVAAVPELAEQYREERLLLFDYVKQYEEDFLSGYRKPAWVITRAASMLSAYRVRDHRSTGWVCGTHAFKVQEVFRRKLSFYLLPEDQEGLIHYCCNSNKEVDEHMENMVFWILRNVPTTIVHPFGIRYL